MTDTWDRFWSRVSVGDDCWLWTRGVGTWGYGVMHFNGKPRGAHRLAYQLWYGVEPGASHVLHSCDQPACVRPSHLKLGSNTENIKDRQDRGRQSKGESHSIAMKRWHRVSGRTSKGKRHSEAMKRWHRSRD